LHGRPLTPTSLGNFARAPPPRARPYNPLAARSTTSHAYTSRVSPCLPYRHRPWVPSPRRPGVPSRRRTWAPTPYPVLVDALPTPNLHDDPAIVRRRGHGVIGTRPPCRAATPSLLPEALFSVDQESRCYWLAFFPSPCHRPCPAPAAPHCRRHAPVKDHHPFPGGRRWPRSTQEDGDEGAPSSGPRCARRACCATVYYYLHRVPSRLDEDIPGHDLAMLTTV
jgi:hypothetical protein